MKISNNKIVKSLVRQVKRANRPSVVIVLTIAVGIFTLLLTHAASFSISLEPENGQASGKATKLSGLNTSIGGYVQFGNPVAGTCGFRVPNYSYTRPFGPNAAWNIPACNVPKSARSADWVARLWNYSSPLTAKGAFITDFGLSDGKGPGGTDSDASNHYGVPFYNAAESNVSMRVRRKGGLWNGVVNLAPNDLVPFNKSWRPTDGKDGQLAIQDWSTGRDYGFWNVSWGSNYAVDSQDYQVADNWNGDCSPVSNPENLPVPLGIGYDQNTDLCAAGGAILKDPDGKIADFRTYEGNFPYGGGGGVPGSAGVVQPEEVSAGEIRHAIVFAIFNSMFGPVCPKSTPINDPSIGTTCGVAYAPAGQFENGGHLNGNDGRTTSSKLICSSDPAQVECRSQTVPEGMRFAINMTDPQITDWINSRGYTGVKATTARVFAVAMRDYGFMITNTSGGATNFAISDSHNPETAAKWRALGIDGGGKDFLNGLFTQQNLYALDPSYNHCKDGTVSRYSCYAYSTGYQP